MLSAQCSHVLFSRECGQDASYVKTVLKPAPPALSNFEGLGGMTVTLGNLGQKSNVCTIEWGGGQNGRTHHGKPELRTAARRRSAQTRISGGLSPCECASSSGLAGRSLSRKLGRAGGRVAD